MKKILILCMAMVLPSACLANDDQQLAKIALEQAQTDLDAYSEALDACKKSESTLPKDIFSGLSLTLDQKKLVMMYHATKANYECAKPAMNQYLVSASILAHYAPEKAEGLSKGGSLLIYDAIKVFELAPRYNELPAGTREKLGTVDVLRKPFNIISSADNLDI